MQLGTPSRFMKSIFIWLILIGATHTLIASEFDQERTRAEAFILKIAPPNGASGYLMLSTGGFAGSGVGSALIIHNQEDTLYVAKPLQDFATPKSVDQKKLSTLKALLENFSKLTDFSAPVLDGYEYQIHNFQIKNHQIKFPKHITLKGIEALDTQKEPKNTNLQLVQAFRALLN